MAVKQRRNVSVGQSEPFVNVFPFPIAANRNPTNQDRAEIGTIWVNTTANESFVLTSIVANVSTWTNFAGGAGVFDALTVAGAGPVDMDVAGAISLDADAASNFSVAGAGIDLTLESAAGRVIIDGGEAAANAVTIEASNVAGGIDMDSGIGGVDIDSTGSIEITSSEAAFDAVVIEATDANGGVVLRTPGAPGQIEIVGGTNTAAGAAITLDRRCFVVTLTGLTTAAGAFETITITNAEVLATTSGVVVSAANLGANDAKMTVVRTQPAVGSLTVILENRGAAALNGDVIISGIILS